jgi:hypothetical protein
VGDLAHGDPAAGEQLGRPVHADPGQVVAERRVADLGVRALELAAGGRHATGDVVERQLAGVFAVDDGDRVGIETRAELDGCGALDWHCLHYGPRRAAG